jgi:hypothetical protein
MERYLITQSIISSWSYMHDCFDGCEDDAREDFLNALNRVKKEPSQAMLNGLAFEDEVYRCAAGAPRKRHQNWEPGIQMVAKIIRGAPVQVRVSRELSVCGMTFLVYGILDALKDGTIYDVKFLNKSLGSTEVYGKYLQSAQHPFYFYLVPEAEEFSYLISDGQDLYIETYRPEICRTAAEIIEEFISSITASGHLDLYKEKWLAK